MVATLDPDAFARRGSDLTLVVAFQRIRDVDVWIDPPTWIVTRTFATQDWWIAPWRNRDLPEHFQRLLVADGVVRWPGGPSGGSGLQSRARPTEEPISRCPACPAFPSPTSEWRTGCA